MKNLKECLLDWFKYDYEGVAISRQALFWQFLILYHEQTYKGERIKGISHYKYPIKAFYNCYDFLLQDESILSKNFSPKGFNYIYKLPSHNKKYDPLFEERIVCSIYPYAYLTYLSAMRIYNFTGLNSNTIHLISVDRETWKKNTLSAFKEKFTEEYGISIDDFPQHLIVPTFPSDHKVLDKELITFTQKDLVLEEIEYVESLRIEDIFSLFLSMTRKPHLCGGYATIVNVISQNIDKFFQDLLKYVDKNGSDIDKSRLGFILDKKLKKSHKIIDKWKIEQSGKRGGSRKLIPNQPFNERFDSDWNISLNYRDIDDYVDCQVKKLIVTTVDLNEIEFQKVFGSILIFHKSNTRYADFYKNSLKAEFNFSSMINHERLFFQKREALIRKNLKELLNTEDITFEYIYRD